MKITFDVTPRRLVALLAGIAVVAAGLATLITWLALRGDEQSVAFQQPSMDSADGPARETTAEADPAGGSGAADRGGGEGIGGDPGPGGEETARQQSAPAEDSREGTGAAPGGQVAAEARGAEAGDVPREPNEDRAPTQIPQSEGPVDEPPEQSTTPERASEVAVESTEGRVLSEQVPEEVVRPIETVEADPEVTPAEADPGGETGGSIVFTREDGPRGEDTLIAANGDTTCAVIEGGGISCWGADSLKYRLATAGFDDAVAVSLSDRKFGENGTAICALHGDGTVSCWGDGHNGRMGQGDDFASVLAVQIPGITDAIAIASGGAHMCALHADGGVSCWGDGGFGQMGDGTDATRRSPYRVPGVKDVVSIAAGYARTCGVHSDGTVTCWGKWQLDGYRSAPVRMSGYQDIVSLAAGVYHLCGVRADGGVFCSRYDPGGLDTTPRSVAGIDDAVAVSVGEGTFCALHRDGGVSCWGANHEGQVGDGTRSSSDQPVRLRDISDAVAVAVSGPNARGEVHSCALREGGGAYCWGNNSYGQLGTGDLEDRLAPARSAVIEEGPLLVDPLPATAAVFLETFVELVVAEEEDEFPWLRTAWASLQGKVAFTEMGTFGGFAQHTCGITDNVYQCEPLLARFSTRFGVSKAIILHEFAHTYDANTEATPTRAWGAVQLYFNVTYKDCFPDIESIGGEYLADTMTHLIEPSAWLTYYESTDIPENRCTRHTPEPTRQDEEVVLAGLAGEVPDWYTEVITDGAELWAAFLSRPGDKLLANIMHEFGGLCSTDWIRYPLDPSLFPPEGTNPFADGGCAEPADAGEVPVAGSRQPPREPGPALVAASGYHTCAVDAAGGVACWGDNSLGLRLGDPSIGATSSPVAVRGLGDVVAISIGDSSSSETDGSTCVLHSDGTVSCWGSDRNGALGRGSPPEDRSGEDPAASAAGPSAAPAIPSKVSGTGDVVDLSVGGRFACVVHTGGEASCWGANALGTLGDGTEASRDWPARVPGLSDVVAISAGWTHACAVHADGRVSCWGANDHGQLGNGTYWDHQRPTAVLGIDDAVAISAGSKFTCAVRRSGGLSCWGSNVSSYHDESGKSVDHIGKLGAGSVNVAESAPVPVLGIEDAVAVATGTSSTCAVHRDGGVSCWGGNRTGEVGIGTREPQMQPRRLDGISDALAITVSSRNGWSGSHACAVTADRRVLCWGDNRYGQLGIGDTEDRLDPTRISQYVT